MWSAIVEALKLIRDLVSPTSAPVQVPTAEEARDARHGTASGAARNYSSRATERAEAARRRGK